MASKLLVFTALLAFSAVLVHAQSEGSFTQGTPYGAHLIYDVIHHKIAIPFIKRDEDFTVKTGNSDLIRAVAVKDLNGGGKSYIVEGGIGQHYVKIHLEVSVESVIVQVIKPEIEKYDYNDVSQVKIYDNSDSNENTEARQVISTLYQTVNKYYCSLDSIINGSILMVYGTNGWTFPVQDVNLTLQYPPENKAIQHFESIFDGENMNVEDEDYIITGFKVILFIDGPNSEGFITDGGVLQDTITLSFISSQLTYLNYEFWVYGASKSHPSVAELTSHSQYRLCQ
ncbi:hypothetical protein PYW07_010435 [Mythimna separata]|uniref:Uncharacterized protein n=1 Tax=Mythimna separata TaxID=271217 RepID=A0AAD7YAL3_MYTSE|nr:hypothetical protein PYW07_010435 [Mythimna separata]